MPNGIELGLGYISLVPSAKGFTKDAVKQINPDEIGDQVSKGIDRHAADGADATGKKIGKGLGGGLSSALAGVGGLLLGGAALGIGKQLFDAASDLNESDSKAQVVFGDAFAKVDEQSQNAAKSLGISRQAALEANATFGNLFRAMGIGVGTAADMSTQMLALASDLASFNNADPAEVLDALKSGLVGETEPLRRFGVNLNEARIKAEALRLGLVKGTVSQVDVLDKTNKLTKANKAQAEALKKSGANSQEYADATVEVRKAEAGLQAQIEGKVPELNAAQKAQSAYNLILQDTSLAQGDFERTADGAANKQRILAATFEDTKAQLGSALLPIGITIMDQALKGLEGVKDWWATNGPGIKQWFTDTFGTDPGANFRLGIDLINQKLDETFGPDKLESFKAGIRELFGLSPNRDIPLQFSQDWDAGFRTISQDVIDFTGLVIMAAERIKGNLAVVWDPLIGVMQTALPAAFQAIWAIADGTRDKMLALKDGVLDPIVGILQTAIPAALEAAGQRIEDLEKPIQFLKENIIDPLFGTLQQVVDLMEKLKDPAALAGDVGGGLFDKARGLLGFDDGGVVPGAIGAPRVVLAHGGETILPTHKASFAPGSGRAGGVVNQTIVYSDGMVRQSTLVSAERSARRVLSSL